MTEKEAILQLKRISNEYALSIDNPFDIAIEVLEKQIPRYIKQRPIHEEWGWVTYLNCPSCDSDLDDIEDISSFSYCPYCGQALKENEEYEEDY